MRSSKHTPFASRMNLFCYVQTYGDMEYKANYKKLVFITISCCVQFLFLSLLNTFKQMLFKLSLFVWNTSKQILFITYHFSHFFSLQHLPTVDTKSAMSLVSNSIVLITLVMALGCLSRTSIVTFHNWILKKYSIKSFGGRV